MTDPRAPGYKPNDDQTKSDFVTVGPPLKMLGSRNGGIWQICDSLTLHRHHFSGFGIFIIEV